MTDEKFRISLTYTKSPKSCNRTTFQLEATVSETAVKNGVSQFKFNTFNDASAAADDDILKEPLKKTRRKKINMFNTFRKKTSINDFQLSDEDEENVGPKKVSFLKSQRMSSSLRSGIAKPDVLRLDTIRSDTLRSDSESPTQWSSQIESHTGKKSPSKSSQYRRSQSDLFLPLYSENRQWESGSVCVLNATRPTPEPHERASPLNGSGCNVINGPTHCLFRGASTSCGSNISQTAVNSWSDDRHVNTGSTSSAVMRVSLPVCVTEAELSVTANTLSGTLEGTERTDFLGAEQKKQEHQLGSEVSPIKVEDASPTWEARSSVSQRGSSRKSTSTSSYTAGSKYLGMLKVLEQKFLQETGVNSADSLRAAAYQDWVKKKEAKLQATFRSIKQEEKLKEEKKSEEEMSKKAEAKASYEAWQQKKCEELKKKIREKQEAVRKLQKDKKDKDERKETAKQVFEKWKQEQNEIFHEKKKKQVQTENRLKEKKEKEKEERKRESRTSFTQWSKNKRELMEEKLKCERQNKEIKEIEENYEEEERKKMALDMYDQWLRKKESQQKHMRKIQKKKDTGVEEPLPPWSPPSRTVPYGK